MAVLRILPIFFFPVNISSTNYYALLIKQTKNLARFLFKLKIIHFTEWCIRNQKEFERILKNLMQWWAQCMVVYQVRMLAHPLDRKCFISSSWIQI